MIAPFTSAAARISPSNQSFAVAPTESGTGKSFIRISSNIIPTCSAVKCFVARYTSTAQANMQSEIAMQLLLVAHLPQLGDKHGGEVVLLFSHLLNRSKEHRNDQRECDSLMGATNNTSSKCTWQCCANAKGYHNCVVMCFNGLRIVTKRSSSAHSSRVKGSGALFSPLPG